MDHLQGHWPSFPTPDVVNTQFLQEGCANFGTVHPLPLPSSLFEAANEQPGTDVEQAEVQKALQDPTPTQQEKTVVTAAPPPLPPPTLPSAAPPTQSSETSAVNRASLDGPALSVKLAEPADTLIPPVTKRVSTASRRSRVAKSKKHIFA